MATTVTESLVEVRLHGHLCTAYGDVFRVAVKTVGEAIRALSANLEGFPVAWRLATHYQILVNGETMPLEEMHLLRRADARVDIVPCAEGAKNAADQQIVFAVAWAAVAVATGGAALGFLTVSKFATTMALTHLFMAAAISLTKEENAANDNESDASRPSKNFNGAVNTTAQGRPVPLCYGRLRIGSHVVSAALVTEDVLS